ncbi:MAG TPA: bifunctional serine/threonine-protein kinase/universal stress protein [Steroidobacteraceae bacterium]|nr:bifunctional serine/threonine-protein kinase/universal stress protein [Steroidobacteraceae bacterium]
MPARLHPGAVVDGFVLGDRIHSGAMGDIYRVSGTETGFPLIMKVPRLGDDQSIEGLLAFQTEVMILPALSGTHFPRFVRAGDVTENPFLVLEWLDGRSLAGSLRSGSMSIDEVVRVGAGIADALQSLHLQDAIHFDLKPDNVILRPDGHICLIDFGLAHHARYPDLLAEERRFTAGSTPYVSPEQVLRTRSDPRSDLFALGVVLYEMTTAELPFGVPQSMAGLRDRLWLDPVPPCVRRADTPPWLQEIILRCLEPDAANRYQSAAHVSFDLRHSSQVMLTARASKSRQSGLLAQAGRWWRARAVAPMTHRPPGMLVSNAPVILAAVDTTHPEDERHPALRRVIAQVLTLSTEFRLICVSVIRGGPGAESQSDDARGVSPQVDHLVRLRHWVEPLQLPAQRLSLHVLEGASPAGALLDFARQNHVDLIVIGAPGPDQQALAWWRSVASGVTANAHCSVHVVRVPEAARATS